MKKKIRTFLMLFLITGLFSGCATGKFLHKSYDSSAIDRIVILPFMDNRTNPDTKYDFNVFASMVDTVIRKTLKYHKRYRVVSSGDIGSVSRYSLQDLPSQDPNSKNKDVIDPESVEPEWIKQLGPTSATFVLIPVLEKLDYQNILIQQYVTAKMSTYLFNKKSGELWSKCVGEVKSGGGFLVTAINSALDDNKYEETALFMATGQCLNSIPKRKGPYLLSDE